LGTHVEKIRDVIFGQAEAAIVAAKHDKEYLGITGFPEFTKHAAILAYGSDSAPLKEKRVSSRNSLSLKKKKKKPRS
jgi:aspartate/tyrosine/aromatic aminotransferase